MKEQNLLQKLATPTAGDRNRPQGDFGLLYELANEILSHRWKKNRHLLVATQRAQQKNRVARTTRRESELRV